MLDEPRRSSRSLNSRLDKTIAAYAAAAAAIGVAILAAAPLAEAKIVYTKTRKTFTDLTQPHPLDLNNDGIADFIFSFCSCRPHAPNTWALEGPAGNSVRFGPAFPSFAGALPSGSPIGPKQEFLSLNGSRTVLLALSGYSGSYTGGSWLGGKNAFLGLKFMIHGEVHFGWARLTIPKNLESIVLTGYAYETTPNKPLKAGQTSETASDVTSADTWALPANGPSLGMLARGAEAREIWRRKEELAA